MGSKERLIARLVLWLVQTWLREKYRLVTPQDLEDVVNNYVADLKKIGVRLVLSDRSNQVGEPDEQLSDSGQASKSS